MRALFQILPIAGVCALFAGVGIVHVTSRVMVVSVGYRLSALETENQSLSRDNERLKLELATLKNPTRLEKIAKEQLGMGPPPPGTVVTLKAPAEAPRGPPDPSASIGGAYARGERVARRGPR